jgi:hypothetical protein
LFRVSGGNSPQRHAYDTEVLVTQGICGRASDIESTFATVRHRQAGRLLASHDLGRRRRVKAGPLRGRFASLDPAPPAKGGSYEEDVAHDQGAGRAELLASGD